MLKTLVLGSLLPLSTVFATSLTAHQAPQTDIQKDNSNKSTNASTTPTVVVTTARRHETSYHNLIGNTRLLDNELLDLINAEHLTQSLTHASGVWLSRGNGQESLLAIRSPVLTGAGSCAEFLTLENGIPLRANGFCNVNQLFDTHFELAERIEVVKGSNSARYGSNAIHGAIDVGGPPLISSQRLLFDVGSDEFYRLSFITPIIQNSKGLIAATITSDGGFHNSSGYKQQKLSFVTAQQIGNWQAEHRITFTHLNQETAGYLQRGENAYKDKSLLKINDFEDAYRNNKSFRYSLSMESENDHSTTRFVPYLRWNRMDFLMHFLPGTPVETNGHYSIGVQWSRTQTLSESVELNFGFDGEVTEGFLTQTQSAATESNSAFLREVLPQGKHYDYQVTARNLAAYTEINWSLTSLQDAFIAARFDRVDYDYNNRMLDGNTRDDGSVCGFGGCRYTRPADRNDNFNNSSFAVGWSYLFNDDQRLFIKYDDSFRAPHTAELYRLQNGQQVAAIDNVNARQWELGLRQLFDSGFAELTFYHLRKNDGIYQDSDRQYLNGLNTSHRGIELDSHFRIDSSWQVSTNVSYAIHRYENNPTNGVELKGNDIDTAPRWMFTGLLRWTPDDALALALEAQHLDRYYIDAANTQDYSGHTVFHFRARWQLQDDLTIALNIQNLFDRRYAERADYAFGNHRYFVGEPRNGLLSIEWQL